MEQTATRKGDWIQTATGKKFWPLDPRTEDVDVRDIAHSLAHLCRFTGHTNAFYSVAQHCVMASQIAGPGAQLVALLHDAAEAYIGDISRPLKRYLHVRLGPVIDRVYETMKEIENRILDVILAALGAEALTDDTAVWDHIKKIDEVLLVTEARDFMSPLADGWRHRPENGYYALPNRIDPWPPIGAKNAFLKRFEELTGQRVLT